MVVVRLVLVVALRSAVGCDAVGVSVVVCYSLVFANCAVVLGE